MRCTMRLRARLAIICWAAAVRDPCMLAVARQVVAALVGWAHYKRHRPCGWRMPCVEYPPIPFNTLDIITFPRCMCCMRNSSCRGSFLPLARPRNSAYVHVRGNILSQHGTGSCMPAHRADVRLVTSACSPHALSLFRGWVFPDTGCQAVEAVADRASFMRTPAAGQGGQQVVRSSQTHPWTNRAAVRTEVAPQGGRQETQRPDILPACLAAADP